MARFNDKNVMLVGLKGKDGLSAYEVAVKNGFEGTEDEWLESLSTTNLQNGEGTDSLVQKYSGEVDDTHYGNTNTGESAVVFGEANKNSANRALQAGKLNENSGANTIQAGLWNENTAVGVTQNGQNNKNSGVHSIQSGNYNTNDAKGVIQSGQNNFNKQKFSVVVGMSNENYEELSADGSLAQSSIIGGDGNKNSSIGVIMAGHGNTVEKRSGHSITTGFENTVKEDGGHGITYGDHNINEGSDKLVGGTYNLNRGSDTLIEIGNGTSDTDRSNAFEVYKDGRAKVYGTAREDEDVVRKADITTGKVSPPLATNTSKGVIVGHSTAAFIFQNGAPIARPLTPGEYSKAAVTAFVGKGTLEAIKSTYVKEGIVGNTQTLSDTERADACEWLGAATKEEVAEGYVAKLTSKYRVIRDITLEEDTKEVYITTDDNGNPFKLKSAFVYFRGMFTASGSSYFIFRFNGGSIYQMYRSLGSYETGVEYGHLATGERIGEQIGDKAIWKGTHPTTLIKGSEQGLADSNKAMGCDVAFGYSNSIAEIGYGLAQTENMFATGSRIIIMGIDDDE